MTASLALAAGLLAYTAASSAFVGYRLGPMVRDFRKGKNCHGA